MNNKNRLLFQEFTAILQMERLHDIFAIYRTYF